MFREKFRSKVIRPDIGNDPALTEFSSFHIGS